MKMNYLKNIELALSLGYEEITDPNAYCGKYYIKNGLIWIHNIEALKAKLGVGSDEELRGSYDVDSYYFYLSHTDDMVDAEIERILEMAKDTDSVLFYQNTDYSENRKTLESMARLSMEGFDEEILADYARQMSKG